MGTPSSMVDTDRALDVSRVRFTVRLWSYQKIPTSAYPPAKHCDSGGSRRWDPSPVLSGGITLLIRVIDHLLTGRGSSCKGNSVLFVRQVARIKSMFCSKSLKNKTPTLPPQALRTLSRIGNCWCWGMEDFLRKIAMEKQNFKRRDGTNHKMKTLKTTSVFSRISKKPHNFW